MRGSTSALICSTCTRARLSPEGKLYTCLFATHGDDFRAPLRSGQSDEQIRQAYVDRYGESILLKPEGSGLGILVWALPVVLLVVGVRTLTGWSWPRTLASLAVGAVVLGLVAFLFVGVPIGN